MPTFSFLVPTHREDRPLQRCLDSLEPQLAEDDQVIVIGDTHDGPMLMVERLVASYGSRFTYLAHDAGHHCFGHCQLNQGIERATGDYIHCNDDDDVWAPNAVDIMRRVAVDFPGRPLLFRFRAHFGMVFWIRPGLVQRDFIGGHCLVAPNLPGKVGRWAEVYSGDFDWIESTLNLHGGFESAVWREEIIAIARPTVGAPV